MAKGFGRAKRRREKLEQAHNRLKVLDQMIPWKVFADCLEQLKQYSGQFFRGVAEKLPTVIEYKGHKTQSTNG